MRAQRVELYDGVCLHWAKNKLAFERKHQAFGCRQGDRGRRRVAETYGINIFLIKRVYFELVFRINVDFAYKTLMFGPKQPEKTLEASTSPLANNGSTAWTTTAFEPTKRGLSLLAMNIQLERARANSPSLCNVRGQVFWREGALVDFVNKVRDHPDVQLETVDTTACGRRGNSFSSWTYRS